ncbi:MAG: phosphoadenosine phosphosulfate reductase family protein [Defluviitaleaceae bacterium]|nr:phosphoadenosine phosphosulfate reductase family protein [Defluviitaleaceae bacterium]
MSENRHTIDQLKMFQAYPLDIKIRKTELRIMEYYDYYGGDVYVAFSGGKDSTILLDIVRRLYPDIPAVFCDTGLEYPEIRNFVKSIDNVIWIEPDMTFTEVIKMHGFPVISKDVAKIIKYAKQGKKWAFDKLNGVNRDGTPNKFKQRYKKWKYLVDAPFDISDYCCKIMKIYPFERFERKEGLHAIVGTIAYEGYQRTQSWLKVGCNSFNKNGKSQPMAFWTEQDVLRYLKDHCKLGYSNIYGDIVDDIDGQITLDLGENNQPLSLTGCNRTGCMFCMFGVHLEKKTNRFQRMKQTHPQIYDYCIKKLGCGEVLDFVGVKY